jgi:hypothetical protein
VPGNSWWDFQDLCLLVEPELGDPPVAHWFDQIYVNTLPGTTFEDNPGNRGSNQTYFADIQMVSAEVNSQLNCGEGIAVMEEASDPANTANRNRINFYDSTQAFPDYHVVAWTVLTNPDSPTDRRFSINLNLNTAFVTSSEYIFGEYAYPGGYGAYWYVRPVIAHEFMHALGDGDHLPSNINTYDSEWYSARNVVRYMVMGRDHFYPDYVGGGFDQWQWDQITWPTAGDGSLLQETLACP